MAFLIEENIVREFYTFRIGNVIHQVAFNKNKSIEKYHYNDNRVELGRYFRKSDEETYLKLLRCDKVESYNLTKVLGKLTTIMYEKEDIKCDINFNCEEFSDVLDFFSSDLIDLGCNYFVEVSHIYVPKDKRNKGIGTRILLELFDKYLDNIIAWVAGISLDEYSTLKDLDLDELFSKLDKLYTRLGAKSINEYIELDDLVPYVYLGNKAGREFYRKLRV